MFIDLIAQARKLLGSRRFHSGIRWQGQFGFACPQLDIHDFAWGDNRVVNTGIDAILNGYFRSENLPGLGGLCIAAFAADVTPPATLTAANFNSTLTEFTNYSEATRPVWTLDGASTAQLLQNDASPALFTVAGGAQTAIYGAVLHTNNVKSGTNGVIIAGAKAPAAFTGLATGFEVKIKYRLTGASS
jgi:hypothetical protein